VAIPIQAWHAKLHELTKELSKSDTAELRTALGYLEKAGEYNFARDVLLKLNDAAGKHIFI